MRSFQLLCIPWIHELRNPRTLRDDTVAGISVALILVPQSMAYAQLAGLPLQYGLYCAFLPCIIAGIFGSSRQLSTGPTALVSLMTANALATYAFDGPEVLVAAMVTLTLLVGVINCLLAILRAGIAVQFIARPVIIGFSNAAALIIALSQVDNLLGIEMSRSSGVYETLVSLVASIQAGVFVPALGMGAVTLGIIAVLKRRQSRLPAVLIAVFVTTGLSVVLGYRESGGMVVGAVPSGPPPLRMPPFSAHLIRQLLPDACVIALVGFIEVVSIAKMMAIRSRQRWEVNKELFARGLANIAGSFTMSFPASGSFSRSAVNFDAGAKTGFSSVVAGLFVLCVLLWLTPLLSPIPQATLAAIIIFAVAGLVQVEPMIRAWRSHRYDGITAVATFLLTLVFAPRLDVSIAIASALALILYLVRTMRPLIVELGRYPDGTLRDAGRWNLKTCPSVSILRLDSSLFFINTGYVEEAVMRMVWEKPRIRFVIIAAEGINRLDFTSEETLESIVRRLEEIGVQTYFAGLKRRARALLMRSGFCRRVGENRFFSSREKCLNHVLTLLGDEHRETCSLVWRNVKGKERNKGFTKVRIP